MLASGRPPADWHRFVQAALAVEHDLHEGSAGVADEAFYAPLLAHLARHGAPTEATAAVRFTHALRRWDWAAATDAAEQLAPLLARGEAWVDGEMLHDGAVVAALKLGDAARAQRIFTATGRAVERSQDELRTDLLPAWVAAAVNAAAPRAAPTPAAAPR